MIKIRKVILLVLSIALIYSCNKEYDKSINKKKSIINKSIISIVKIKRITTNTIIKVKSFNSVLQPKKDIVLISQSSGLITKLNFDIGAKVKKNQILVIIDTSLKKIDLDLKKVIKEEAEHQLKYVKALLEKNKILVKRNIINKETFDISKNKVINAGFMFKKALLSYSLAKIQYNKSFVYSPFDGVIIARNKQKGDIVTIGAPLGRIIDNKNLEAIIGVTLEDLSNIKSYSKNKQIKVSSQNNQKCKAKIIGISESLEQITKLYPIKLSISNCSLINGTQVKIEIPIKEYKNALEVKRNILEFEDGNYYLFILKNNKAIKTKVKLLNDNNNGNMIIRINTNTKIFNIITEGHIGLINNQKVKVMGNNESN